MLRPWRSIGALSAILFISALLGYALLCAGQNQNDGNVGDGGDNGKQEDVLSGPIPPCITDESQLVYQNGVLAVGKTIQACIDNIPDPMLIPNLYNGTYIGEPIKIGTRFQVNQVQDIDALAGKCTMDFYMYLSWNDARMGMPLMWERVDNTFRMGGIDIQDILYDLTSGYRFWLPNQIFNDALDFRIMGQSIKLYDDNSIIWIYHGVVTLAESLFDFSAFPHDEQVILVRYAIFGHNKTFVEFEFYDDSGLTYAQNYDGRQNIFFNSEWEFLEEEASVSTYESTVGIKTFDTAIIFLPMRRYAWGILLRIIIPLFIIVFLAAATFWIPSPEARIAGVMSLILAISAVYIIIMGYIPLVGYETAADSYVIVMMVFLALILIFHCVHMSLFTFIHDQDDLRLVTKYSFPLRYLFSMFQRDDEDDRIALHHQHKEIRNYLYHCNGGLEPIVHAQPGQSGKGSADEAVNKSTRRRNSTRTFGEFADGKDIHRRKQLSEDTNSYFDDGMLKSEREMEYMKPRLTLIMYILQAIGRTIFPALLLFFSGFLMFMPLGTMGSQTVYIGFTTLAVLCLVFIGFFETWSVMCKYWELRCASDEYDTEREAVMHHYVELQGYLVCALDPKSSVVHQDMDDRLGRVLKVYEHIMHEHEKLMHLFTDWLEEINTSGRLPNPSIQLMTFRKYTKLLREHDVIRATVLETLQRDDMEQWRDDLENCDSLLTAYSVAVEYQHALLEDVPAAADELRSMYRCGMNASDIHDVKLESRSSIELINTLQKYDCCPQDDPACRNAGVELAFKMANGTLEEGVDSGAYDATSADGMDNVNTADMSDLERASGSLEIREEIARLRGYIREEEKRQDDSLDAAKMHNKVATKRKSIVGGRASAGHSAVMIRMR